jgi:pimeloyl-ACP methyl ester carboxylesterase
MSARKTYVLVHGAYHGGWCWKFVAEILRAQGHTVFTPTLTGLGERAHLLNLDPDLDLMIADIVQVIDSEELTDVILVGHSFGGAVVSGVVDCMAEKIRRLVYLDALILRPGTAVLEDATAESLAFFSSLKRDNGGSGVISIPPLSFFALEHNEHAEWLKRRLTPHPVLSFFSKLQLHNPLGNGRLVTYITCTDPYFDPTAPARKFAHDMPGWQHLDIATGHDAMISAPRQLAQLFAGLA